MKILIADDDEIIRKTFIEKIMWEENGYEIVGVAKNGVQAYEMALYTCPDIILSDIEMPFMSGLDLAEKILEVLENTRIIFLTAYDSFDYAREALRLHACEYILKDSKEEEILRAVNKAAEEIRSFHKNTQLTRIGQEILREKQIFRLLLEEITDEERQSICNDLQINQESCSYQVIVLKVGKEDTERRPSETSSAETRLKNAVTEYFNEKKERYFITTWKQYQILLLERGEDQSKDEAFVEEMIAALEQNRYRCAVTAGIGRRCGDMVPFSASFDDAVFAVNDDTQEQVRLYRELGQSKFIREIRKYIMENFADPELSLNKLSEQVYLTPTYISQLFKRYTNSNFKDYLVHLRIKEACKLLKNTELKSYEISVMVGYPNPQYFSVLFKKCTGETPTQYHNKFYGTAEKNDCTCALRTDGS